MVKKKIGVVLSGGGARGLAHIGFLQALNELGIYPEYISGCSVGAIIGALYASGCDSKQMLNYFITNSNIFSILKVSMGKSGMFNSDKYISSLNELIANDSFEDLKYKLTINATDVLEGKTVYFNSGKGIKQKIIASAAVPGIFSPVQIDGSYYIDGGTMDNFPIKPLLNKDLIIFGSYLSTHDTIDKDEISSTVKLVSRASLLAFNSEAVNQLHLCDHLLAPQSIAKYTLFDVTKLREIYETGYHESINYLKDLNLESIT